MRKIIIIMMFTMLSAVVEAQIGLYRNDLSIGVNGGYVLSSVGFSPKVNQTQLGGITGGVSFRYVCEKYFSTICAIQAEVNYAQVGWKEKILDINDAPVINTVTGLAENYSRTLTYVQIPIFAHLGWGREQKGVQFFFQAGPQIGFNIGESTSMNFDIDQRNSIDRVNNTVAQDTMAVENKFDYGIAAGFGLEYSHPKVGHFQLEARYYYGLGNIYGDSKKDYFGKSNISNIVVKLTYLFDLIKTKR
ncbi:MAG: PorT family protein [Prevotella sp.]|nr:PorT family protein [Prevotella sp.]